MSASPSRRLVDTTRILAQQLPIDNAISPDTKTKVGIGRPTKGQGTTGFDSGNAVLLQNCYLWHIQNSFTANGANRARLLKKSAFAGLGLVLGLPAGSPSIGKWLPGTSHARLTIPHRPTRRIRNAAAPARVHGSEAGPVSPYPRPAGRQKRIACM